MKTRLYLINCLMALIWLPLSGLSQITIENNLLAAYSTEVFSCSTSLDFSPVVNTSCATGLSTVSIAIDFQSDGNVEINASNSWNGNFPLGNHRLSVTATDDCGNSQNTTFDLSIVDQVPPVAICDVDGVITLNSPDDIQYLRAIDIDDGSYDNCSAVSLKVTPSNMLGNPQDSIPIDTSDVGNNQLFVLHVTDAAGNTNQCLIEVDIFGDCPMDMTAPIANCRYDSVIILDNYDATLDLRGSHLNQGSYDECSPVIFTLAGPNASTDFRNTITIDSSYLGPNVFQLKVTDASGNSSICDTKIIVVVDVDNCGTDTIPPIAVCQANVVARVNNLGDVQLRALWLDDGSYDICSHPPVLTYTLLDPDGTPFLPQLPIHTFDLSDLGSYTYRLYATDAAGLVDSCEGTLEIINENFDYIIQGNVFSDANQNCTFENSETPVPNINILAESFPSGYTVERVSQTDGGYAIGWNPPPSDTLTRISLISSINQGASCQNVFYIDFRNLPQGSVSQVDFPFQLAQNCTALDVDIAAPFLRRCFNSYYIVNYCNYGSEVATNAYVEVTLDSFLTYTNSSIPFSSVNGQTYTFDLGSIAPAECGSFLIDVDISCDALLGQTHCTEAHIYPDTSCTPPSSNWSGASIKVDGFCEGDTIYFEIQNIGTEDMPAPLNYIIIEDIIIHRSSPFQLDAGETQRIAIEGKGKTCRIEAEQEPFHPGFSQPSYAVEACGELPGGGVSLGFITQFPQNEADPFIAIDCQENIGSYDPNDKNANPKGVEAAHYIEANTFIKYKIRFQNTGTDTAFTVIIEDPLPDPLDASTIVPGASSHPYIFELDPDGTARFIFQNIYLPDSNTNLAASQGFVNFTIQQQPNNPEGTLIQNEAAITFDFNEPIITNIAFHEIREDFLVVNAYEVRVPDVQLRLMPNPFRTSSTLLLEGLEEDDYTFKLYAADGQLLRTHAFSGNTYTIERHSLPEGFYFFSIEKEGILLANGKLICQ